MITTNAVNNFNPTLIYSDPFDGETTFKFDQAITLNFNEIVAAGSGNVLISNGSDTRTIAINDKSQVTTDSNNVIINPSNLLINKRLAVDAIIYQKISFEENPPDQ